MILIGSAAACLHHIKGFSQCSDLDLIGTIEEIPALREALAQWLLSEQCLHGHRIRFTLSEEAPWRKVEYDYEQSPSDVLLYQLCSLTASISGLTVQIPSPTELYLIKRAHANNPLAFRKTLRHLVLLRPCIGVPTDDQMRFYRLRKDECTKRFRHHRQRFSLSVSNDAFFALSDHLRSYEHDDIHNSVAFEPFSPLYRKCKHDLGIAKIELTLFRELPFADQLRMVQEEFMVIGIERFYVAEPQLTASQVYQLGLEKTIRDLFVGFFQDFCLDHVHLLQAAPSHPFLDRFNADVAAGRIRRLAQRASSVSDDLLSRLHQSLQAGEADHVRASCEDLIRSGAGVADVRVLLLMGLSLERLRRYPQALRFFRRTVELKPQYALGWFHCARSLRLVSDYDGSIQAMRQAILHGCNHPNLSLEAGMAFLHANQPDHARLHFETALSNPATSTKARQLLARLA